MDKESLFTKLVNNTMVGLKKIKVFIFGKMEGNIKENGKKGNK